MNHDNLSIMAIGVVIGLIIGSYLFTHEPVKAEDCEDVPFVSSDMPKGKEGSGLLLACTDQFEKCIYQQ